MREKNTAAFVGAIIGNIIGLAVVNTVPLWAQLTHGVVLRSWVDVLWAVNLSLIVQIIGNGALTVYRPARLYSLIQAIFAAVGLLSVIVFYEVFPLDFSQVVGAWLNALVRLILIVAIAGTLVALIVNLVRAVTRTPYTAPREE